MNKNNYYKKSYSITAFDGMEWIDVTERSAIIYGAGKGCMDMMNELLLPNVAMVLDGNKELQGKEIMLMSKIYEINSPQVLMELEYNEYYIVVSSEKYYEDIKTDIFRACGSGYLVCMWKDGIRFCYKSLEEMMLSDNRVHNKLATSRMTRNAYDIIMDFKDLEKHMNPEPSIEFYIPLKKGWSKFSFIFGNSEKLWVYHHVGYVNTFEKRTIEREAINVKRIREEYINNHGLDSELTLYRNTNSIIQIYAENRLELSDEKIQRKIIKKMRELHALSIDNLPDSNFTNVFFEDQIEKVRQLKIAQEIKDAVIGKVYRIGKESAEYINSTENSLCVIHGDLISDNIVLHDSEICFIDWEFISKGFPEIDICYLIFSIKYSEYSNDKMTYSHMCESCFDDIYETLIDYYGTEQEANEHLKIAYAVMNLCIIRDILQTCLWNTELGTKKTNAYIAISYIDKKFY